MSQVFLKMDTKEDAESQEDRAYDDRPPSPYVVLQQISEEAFKLSGESFHNAYGGNQTLQPVPPAHRRSQSEILNPGHKRSSSFQKLKNQMQKAWRWGGNSKEQDYCFNPEILANQKRLWYQLHSKTPDHTKYKEPTSLYEHFIIAGLHPDANLEAVEDVFARRKKWEIEASKSDIIAYRKLQFRGPTYPSMEPQILFKYPPGKRLGLGLKDLCSFCFPEGVKTRLLERTPSLSELNELVYGQLKEMPSNEASHFLEINQNSISEYLPSPPSQGRYLREKEHMGRDDLAFMFSLKVTGNDTLYGVCLHVTEIVQRSPGIAPTAVVRTSIIAQERLNRITQFVSEVSLSCVPSDPKQHDQMNTKGDYNDKECDFDWTASAIPVDSAVALTAVAARIILDDEIPNLSPKIYDSHSPEGGTTSDASDLSQGREVDKDGRKNMHYFDDCTLERMDGSYENSLASPDVGICNGSRSHTLERIGSFDNIFSPARSIGSVDEDDELFASCEKDYDDDLIMGWARENKNDFLQIVCGYHSIPLPQRESEVVFQPLEHLQAIKYRRPTVSALGFSENYLSSFEAAEINLKVAAAEEAHALSIWTTATICRVLSLESILMIVTGVLLEKQVVVVCPNLLRYCYPNNYGVLSAVVLSLVPLIRPFQWQSLFLPVGIQQKPADLKMRTFNLVHVNVLRNQVKMCHLPALPRYRELASQLAPFHARLSFESSVARKLPVYRCNEVQAEAATQFLTIMKQYLESICSGLRSHTITNVQSNNDRVCLLLKDSFIDSFPGRDRLFIKLFVDTQLFAVLSDNRLSSFENGNL